MKYDQPLTDAQRVLVENNLYLIPRILNRMPVFLFDSRDDAYQIGAIGLIKAARCFDPTRNVRFPTYAARCIVNELLMAMRRVNRDPLRNHCSIDAPLTLANGETVSLADIIPSDAPQPEDSALSRDSLTGLLQALRALPDADAFNIICMAFRGKRQADMALMLGCTQSAVSRKLSRIRSALRETMT